MNFELAGNTWYAVLLSGRGRHDLIVQALSSPLVAKSIRMQTAASFQIASEPTTSSHRTLPRKKKAADWRIVREELRTVRSVLRYQNATSSVTLAVFSPRQRAMRAPVGRT